MKAKGTYFLDSYLANKARAKPDDRARAPRRRSALSHPLSHSAFPARAPPDRQRGLQQGLLQQRPLDPAPRRALRQRTLAGGGAQAMPLWVWLTCRSIMSPVVWARCRMCVCVLCACSYDLSEASRCDGRKVDCACTVKKSNTDRNFLYRDRKLYSVVECDHSERPQSSAFRYLLSIHASLRLTPQRSALILDGASNTAYCSGLKVSLLSLGRLASVGASLLEDGAGIVESGGARPARSEKVP